MADTALSILAIFFLKNHSFLDFQQNMQHRRLNPNCRTLFGMHRIPSDNVTHNLLDGSCTAAFHGLFSALL